MMRRAVRGPLAEAVFLAAALLRNRFLAIRRDWQGRSLYVFAIFFGTGAFLGILAGSAAGTAVLRAASARGLLATMPAWAFLVYLFTDVLVAFGQALGDLYLSRDMPILLAMPLRTASVVFAKFAVGVAQNGLYAAIFLLPFAAGYLAGLGAPWWTYAIAALLIALFVTAIYGALTIGTIGILRFLPPKIAREVLWLAGASIPTVFWFLSFYKVAHVRGDVIALRLPDTPAWLPSTWAGNAVAALGSTNPAAVLPWLAWLVLFAGLAAPAAIAAISASLGSGWNAAAPVPSRRRKRAEAASSSASPAAAIAIKDIKTLLRSPQLWFSHIAALGFVAYLIVGHSAQTPLLRLTPQLAMVQISFVAMLGALNPGMTALSLEHMAVWILKAAPVAPEKIVRAKFGVAYLQTAAISAIAAGALAWGYGFGSAGAAMLVMTAVAASASAVSVGLAFDACHPCFTWENPNHVNRGLRMLLPFLLNLGLLTAFAVALYALRASLGGAHAAFAGVGFVTGMSMIVTALALRVAQRGVAALEV